MKWGNGVWLKASPTPYYDTLSMSLRNIRIQPYQPSLKISPNDYSQITNIQNTHSLDTVYPIKETLPQSSSTNNLNCTTTKTQLIRNNSLLKKTKQTSYTPKKLNLNPNNVTKALGQELNQSTGTRVNPNPYHSFETFDVQLSEKANTNVSSSKKKKKKQA